MNCPFCPDRLYKDQILVIENDQCLFLQQPQRILIGSGFIIPRAHRETVFDLTDEESRRFMDSFSFEDNVTPGIGTHTRRMHKGDVA